MDDSGNLTLPLVLAGLGLLLFIVGDILGTGVYALTGTVAGQVGGAGWAPVLLAFAVALITACSYMELVTKYPRAAGAALYAQKAFGIHFITFLVAFAVLSSAQWRSGDRRHGAVLVVMTLCCAALTQLIFPLNYSALVTATDPAAIIGHT